jgi:hypothetical protein
MKMIKFPQKKHRKPKTTARPRDETPDADFHLIDILGLACMALACCGFIAAGGPPAQSVGDITQFTGAALLPHTGQTPVRAAIVSDVWGHEIGRCRLKPSAMFAAKGAMQISAISKQEIVVQWLGSAKAPGIGCPAAPALLAVSTADYQKMVTLVAKSNARRQYK